MIPLHVALDTDDMNNEMMAEHILDIYRGKYKKAGTVEYSIIEKDDYRILSIAGSDGWQDWMMNIRFIPFYSPTLGWVHSGFWWSIQKLWKAEQGLLLDGKPTYVQGHSKGAAEASQVAGLMVKGGNAPKGLLIFGAPRCAFKELGKILKPVYCVRPVNDGDTVTKLPPKGFILRYRHVCSAIPTGKKFTGHSMSTYRDAGKVMKTFFS